MSEGRGELVNPTRRLPDLSLPTVADGSATPLRARGRKAPVLVLVHGPGCEACAAFVGALAAEPEVAEWDGRPLVVAPGGGAVDGPLPAVVDAEGRVAAALGVRAPALVIADQWGEIHELREAGEEHRFPPVAEVVSTLRYLAIQCPECQGEAY